MRRAMVAALVTVVSVGYPVDAAVLCQRHSGALFVRPACKKKETPVDPAAVGLSGPKGDTGAPGEARAYACSEVSVDGTLVVGCQGRPSKNVVSIVANSFQDNVTCFVLDPSIDAASAIAVASFADASLTTSVNVILSAIGTNDQVGCPANSIVVRTGRFRQEDTGTGMFLESARLPVNIAIM